MRLKSASNLILGVYKLSFQCPIAKIITAPEKKMCANKIQAETNPGVIHRRGYSAIKKLVTQVTGTENRTLFTILTYIVATLLLQATVMGKAGENNLTAQSTGF